MLFTRLAQNRLLIVLVTVAVLAAGTFIYYQQNPPAAKKAKTENVRAVHEQEVQKALRELRADRIAEKKLEAVQKDSLRMCNEELKSLNTQFRNVLARLANETVDLDEIERPRLFRSRAKKEAQISAELRRRGGREFVHKPYP